MEVRTFLISYRLTSRIGRIKLFISESCHGTDISTHLVWDLYVCVWWYRYSDDPCRRRNERRVTQTKLHCYRLHAYI